MRKLATILGGLFAACLAGAAEPARDRDANWAHWRGPHADGTATLADPPTTWDAKTNIKWTADLPGRGSATPIVWGDRVFVVAAVPTDRAAKPEDVPPPDPKFEQRTAPPTNYYQFIVYCFDRQTGKVRWKDTAAEMVPHEGHHQTHSYAAGSPTTDGTRLYVSFGSFGLYCYDLDGKRLWQRDLGRMHTRLGWGEAVTPVVHGDALIINWDQETESKLICLNAATGKTRWETPRDEKTSWTTPLVVEHAGKTQIVMNGTSRVRGYDLATGKEIWTAAGTTVNAIPSPVAGDGVVYVMGGYQGSTAVAVDLGSAGEVKVGAGLHWRYDKGTPYVPSPLLLGGRLYFTQQNQNLLTILDAKSGKVLLDRDRLPAPAGFYASPASAAGRIYLVARDGTTLVLKAGDTLDVLATNRLNDAIDASPALAGKQLFLRSHKRLYCIEKP